MLKQFVHSFQPCFSSKALSPSPSFRYFLSSAVYAAPFSKPDSSSDVIPDSYIVVLKKDVSSDSFDSHIKWANNVHKRNVAKRGLSLEGMKHTWAMGEFKAYSGAFSSETIDDIKKHEHVAHVEKDRYATAQGWSTQENPPSWGLSRVSDPNPGNHEYTYDGNGGSGVTVFVIDSGIYIEHEEFEGRATWGANFLDGDNRDLYGHGTHVAGTIGSVSYGVAKKVNLVAVKCLDGRGKGPWSAIIAAIHWTVDEARKRGILGKTVINFSLGGEPSPAVDAALVEAHKAGIFISAAAGNFGSDARSVTPGSASLVCVVGNSDENNYRWTGKDPSNWGPRVDIFAPGTRIMSTLPNGGFGPSTGTSMAAPHVAGQVAIYISHGNFDLSAACEFLKQKATPTVQDPGQDTTNRLLSNGSGKGGPGPNPDQKKPDQNKPDQNKPDQNKPDQNKPDQNKPDQNKPPGQNNPQGSGEPENSPPTPSPPQGPNNWGPSWWDRPSPGWLNRPNLGWWNRPYSGWKP
ncbi:proteinase T [Nannizzia gypsea CBS 118893]|uniref:Proteinase T n=1 Tax=Arthroderma gypseum (strain ATCC MYA-4604 / CBS 118893) TaxID=535722 RepID=E4UY98_ARTGP|nr:proteinase T [Nannizzia gypsea CBS 118893]EFR02061.1 proteinase T [Nannizzia gypsea CBS 118893]